MMDPTPRVAASRSTVSSRGSVESPTPRVVSSPPSRSAVASGSPSSSELPRLSSSSTPPFSAPPSASG